MLLSPAGLPSHPSKVDWGPRRAVALRSPGAMPPERIARGSRMRRSRLVDLPRGARGRKRWRRDHVMDDWWNSAAAVAVRVDRPRGGVGDPPAAGDRRVRVRGALPHYSSTDRLTGGERWRWPGSGAPPSPGRPVRRPEVE